MLANYTIEEFEWQGQLCALELEIDFSVTPYDPGRCSGPPELCYPPEGGDIDTLDITVTSATIGGDMRAATADECAAMQAALDATDKYTTAIEERCMEYAAERDDYCGD